jgi:hypothetical protein
VSDDLSGAPNKAHQAVLARVSAFCRLGIRRAEVDGIAVTVADAFDSLALIYASDVRAQRLSDLEFALGQGPALSCFEAEESLEVDDLTLGSAGCRWPAYAPEAVRNGVGAVFVLPLVYTGHALGTVSLYRTLPGPLTSWQRRQVESVTEMINLALVSPEAQAGVGTSLRMAVHQAAGMVMEQTGMQIHDALVLLKATAYSEGKPVDEVADEVVKGGRRFTRIEAHDE